MRAQSLVRSQFAETLLARREALGYTQDYVARKLGVSDGAVSKWESGEREPNYTTLIRLAKLLSTRIDTLLGAPDAPDAPMPHLKYSRAKRLTDAASEIVELLVAMTPDDDDETSQAEPPRPPDHPTRARPAAKGRGPQRGTA